MDTLVVAKADYRDPTYGEVCRKGDLGQIVDTGYLHHGLVAVKWQKPRACAEMPMLLGLEVEPVS